MNNITVIVKDNIVSDNTYNNKIIYVNVCSKEIDDYLKCIHKETFEFSCDKYKLLQLLLECQSKII